MCYDGAFKEPKQVSFADSDTTEPSPVTYYVSSSEDEVTRHESSDIAEEVHKSLLVEELKKDCFQLAINRTKLGNNERIGNRRVLKSGLGLLLLMTPC